MKAFFLYPELVREFRYADWLEIGTAAALLRRIGWEVEGFHWKSARTTEGLKRALGDSAADIVVTLIHPDQAPMAIEINRHLKSVRPQTVTLACGIWPTLSPDAAVAAKVFDALILGEWEPALTEFGIAFQDQKDYTKIPNFWVKKRSNDVKRLPVRPPADLDAFPAPDRDLFSYPQILQINGGLLPMQASRSCPYHCAFCHEPVYAAIQGAGANPYRYRSPEKVVVEGADLAHIFAPERILFVDQLFPWDEAWLAEFAEQWRTRVGLPFTITSVAEALTPRTLDLLGAAGCDQVALGIETGDERVRRSISDRNVGNKALFEARQNLRDRGMELLASNMIGLPGESPETLEATIRLNQELRPSAICSRVFDPIPQTPLAAYIEAQKIETEERGADTVDPDISRLHQPELSQSRISQAYDRLCLLDSVLRSQRRASRAQGYFDVLSHFADGKYRSPFRRGARIATWKRGDDARQVLALRAPTEITFDFIARPKSALAFGLTTEPSLQGLRPFQAIQFGIKIAQDQRTFRIFKKVLIPALDPDARRWHNYIFPLHDIRPGPCRLILQVRISDEDRKKLAPDEEIWGGWSEPHILNEMPARSATPTTMHSGEPAGSSALMVHSGERIQEPAAPRDPHAIPLQPLRPEHPVALDEGPPGTEAERDALAREVGALSARIVELEQALARAEAEMQTAQRRAEQAELRAAKTDDAVKPPAKQPPRRPTPRKKGDG